MKVNIHVLGHYGYIGSNLLNYLLHLDHSAQGLDPRKSNIEEIKFEGNDIILDCSRIKHFDPVTLREDYESTINLLGVASRFNATYVRIGSVLEIDSQATSSPYIEWSRQRSKTTLSSRNELTSKLILIPNIYGGIGSSSIIDLLKSAKQMGKEIILDHPTSKRDFLSMNNFLTKIHEILFATALGFPPMTILTSGFVYEVQSIQSFLKAQDTTLLLKQQSFYNSSGEIMRIEDGLVKYLLDY